jgi:hypothetical protein
MTSHSITWQRRGKLAHRVLDSILTGKDDLRTGPGQGLRDGPGDAATVGDAKNQGLLSF